MNGDGVTDRLDAALLLRYLVGLAGEEAIDPDAADANEDGHIDHADAALLLRVLSPK